MSIAVVVDGGGRGELASEDAQHYLCIQCLDAYAKEVANGTPPADDGGRSLK